MFALITVKEHMVMEPGRGFTKSIPALIINKYKVQKWEFLEDCYLIMNVFRIVLGDVIDFHIDSELGPKDVA